MLSMTSTHNSRATLFSLIRKYQWLFLSYKWPLLWGVLALVATNLLGIAIPWQIKQAVDTIQLIFQDGSTPAAHQEALWQTFYQCLWLLVLLASLVLACRVASRQFLLGAGRRVEFDLRNRLYEHLLCMPVSYYAAHPPGELMSRMTNDVDATKYLTGGGIMLGVNTILAYVMAVPMLLIINWKLALATFLFYPLVIWMMTRISKRVRDGYRQVQEVLADISTVSQENLNGMMVIQSYVREAHENKRFEALCDHYFGTYTKLIHERILLFMLLAALSGFMMLMVLSVGGWQVIVGQLDWGGFVAFTMYLEHLAWPTMALGWTLSIFQQGTAALERIDDVFSAEPNIRDKEAAGNGNGAGQKLSTVVGQNDVRDGVDSALGADRLPPDESAGLLRIEGLDFTYENPYFEHKMADDGQPLPKATDGQRDLIKKSTLETVEGVPSEKLALQNVNLSIQPGETVALVGPVGSGKSTLLRLLPRLLEVPPNRIFLQGRDITQWPLRDLRATVVFMPQLSFLFSTTISHNIAFGQPDLLVKEPADIPLNMVNAAEIASVHRDILGLPSQYQTLVGERGFMLSGGQRQRVSLARAILMDARVLVLDDPFSNVDAETERNIVAALRERKTFKNRTTLIATHRFSLLALCDRIVLMDAGQVVATGSHEELMRTQPLYQKLHRLQELRTALQDWELEANNNGQSATTSIAIPDSDEDLPAFDVDGEDD